MNSIGNIAYVLNDSDESFSQCCARFGRLLFDDKEFIPVQIALQSFCVDNPKITEESFTTWYQNFLDDKELFKFEKLMKDVLKDFRLLFDAKMDRWIAEGVLDANYESFYAFWGIIGMALRTINEKLERNELREDIFFKDPIFGKYKIIALDYADNSTLTDFGNPRSYDRFDVEALVQCAMGYFDEYEDYKKTREVYQEVKDIVYNDPNRLLGETKIILEERVKHDKKRKLQYAYLYAAAVIEWYLHSHQNRQDNSIQDWQD